MTDAELDAILATAFVGLEVAQAGGSGSGAKKGNRAGGGGAAAAPSKQDQSPAEAPPGLATARRKATGPLMLMDPATQCSACWGWPHKPRQCGRCELVSYCDKRCQEWDWRKHKPNCLTMEEQAAKKAINEELYRASGFGRLHSVRQLLAERGANVNYFSDEGYFPLFAASGGGHVQVVDALLEAGAQVNATRPQDSATALLIACQNVKVAVVQSLVRAGANVNQTTSDKLGSDSPLIIAAQQGHVQVVDVLIAAGARLDYARPKGGCTALYTACRFGLIDVVRSLLSAGADPRLAAHNAVTPLVIAILNHPAIADLIAARLAELASTPAGSA